MDTAKGESMRKFIVYIFLLGVIGIAFALYKAIMSGSLIFMLSSIGGSLFLVLSGIGLYTLIEIRDELKAINENSKK